MEIIIDILGFIALVLLVVWAVYRMVDLVSRLICWIRTKRQDKKYYRFAENMSEILNHAGNHIHHYKYRNYQELVFFIADRIKRVGYISGGELRSRVDKIIEQLNREESCKEK